eukprot:scaffold58418_cov20-Tisochrysis_lutea.AAC.1
MPIILCKADYWGIGLGLGFGPLSLGSTNTYAFAQSKSAHGCTEVNLPQAGEQDRAQGASGAMSTRTGFGGGCTNGRHAENF